MEVKVKFNDINVKEEKEKTLVKILMLKGEKGEKGDGDFNVIEDVKVNGTSLPVSGKSVNVEIPTNNSAFNNDSGYLVENDMQMVETSDVQNGSQIIDGTGYAKLNKIYGDTSQIGTPTPDNPVDIDVVTGDIDITISNSDSSSKQNYLLSLGDIELCKIGNYKDYIYYENGKWYLHKEIGKIDLNTIEWNSSGHNVSGYKRFYTNTIPNIKYVSSNSQIGNGIAEKYKIVKGQGVSSVIDCLAIDISIISVCDKVSPTGLFYYLLETFTDIEITNNELIQQLNKLYNFIIYKNETNFSIISDNLIPILNVSYAITNRDIYSKEEVNDLLDNLKLKTKDYYFNNVSEMKSSSLKLGDIITTLGYYSANDGGGSTYIISDENLTVDNGSVIALNNGYKAVMIIENDTINIKQFGAKGDGINDDTTPIQNALKFRENDYKKIVFNKNNTYLVQGDIFIYSNTDIDLNGSTIKSCSTSTSTNYSGVQFMNNIASCALAGYGAIKNFNVKNGTFHGGTSGLSFCLLHAENFNFENILFQDCFVPTHIFDLGGCKNISIKNCDFTGYLCNLEANNFREMIQPDYARSSSVPYWNSYTTPNFDDLPTTDLLIENCTFEKGNGEYYPNAIGTHADADVGHENITIRNCKFYGCNYSSIRLPKVKNALIENNIFYDLSATRSSDTYCVNLIALNNLNNPSETIKILNNSFKLNNDLNGSLIAIGVRGKTNSLFKNVIIDNNYFESNYDGENNNTGADAIQANDIDVLKFSNNVCYKVKNVLFKGANVLLNHLELINNLIRYCRTFCRTNGDYSTEPETNIIQSNNVWEDSRGSININEFVVTFTISEDITVDTNSTMTVPFNSDNAFFETSASSSSIIMPKFIQRFSYEISEYIDTGSNGAVNRECHSYISRNGITIDKNYNNNNSSEKQHIKVPTSYYENKNLVDSTSTIVVRTSLQVGDIIKKANGNFPGTTITIKGF